MTRAESIHKGLGLLLEYAEKLQGVGEPNVVDTCAEHDEFFARLGIDDPAAIKEELDAKMEELGWSLDQDDDELAYCRST